MVMQCLTQLETNAQFVLMCYGEQVEYKPRVAAFAAWCLAGCLHQDRHASFFGDDHVG